MTGARIAATAYRDLLERLHQAAETQMDAHLIKLEKDAVVVKAGEAFSRCALAAIPARLDSLGVD